VSRKVTGLEGKKSQRSVKGLRKKKEQKGKGEKEWTLRESWAIAPGEKRTLVGHDDEKGKCL